MREMLVPALAALLGIVAYAPMFGFSRGAAPSPEEVLFLPGALPGPLVLGVAGFLLWRRRSAFRSLAGASAPRLAVPLGALGVALFVWARLTGGDPLLAASLAAIVLGAAALGSGVGGLRHAAVPALVLGMGVGLPKPLADEVLWQLQLLTASLAAWLLEAIGRPVVHGGVILVVGEHSFHVIDGCSGLGGVTLLTLVALVVRELFRDAGRRVWWVVASAPPLGLALNAVRVAYVAASPDPEALAGVQGDHTPQGIAVLMAGTVTLYGMGLLLARVLRATPAASPAPVATRARPHRRIALLALAASLAALSLLPPFPEAAPAPRRFEASIPDQRGVWTSERTTSQAMFHGALSGGFHRRYRRDAGPGRPPEFVDLLVGFEDASTPVTFRMLSSKLASPGPEWSVLERRRERIFLLDVEAERALASAGRDERHAVVYAWRPGDRGLWAESWRALLALDRSPLRREHPRVAVRLSSVSPHDGQLALDFAKQRLDAFIGDFREALLSLPAAPPAARRP